MSSEISVRSQLDLTYAGRDVSWLVDYQAEKRPDHPFLIWVPFEGEPRTWTYAGFAGDVARIAAGMAERGVKVGDRVLIHLENCPEILLAWYACARLGAVAVTTNTRSVARDLVYFAEHCGAAAAITQPAFADLVAQCAPNIAWLAVSDNDAGARPAAEPTGNGRDAFASLYGDPSALPARQADPFLDVGIQYTSGTTSRPKGVVWTHANALWGAQVNAGHLFLTGDDVTLTYLPLFHTNAQSYSVLGTLWSGGTVVLQPRFSVSRFWDVSLKYRCTWTSMVPFCLRALATVGQPETHPYRVWGMAAALPEVEKQFRVKTIGWWGMTETITHGLVCPFNLDNPEMSCGRPAPEYEIAIVRDDGSPVGPGETGHLLIRGRRGVSLFKEYLNNPEATAESFDENGWFRTGDRVVLMPEGHIKFSDRDKDMLKVGGENVAASEIEAVIMATGLVSECAVVAQKHKMLDEVPAAFIIPGPTAGDDAVSVIMAACRENLADFKVPREIRVVEDMPRSTLEKIAKAELRKQLPQAG
ncbi:MAG: AMP-binding protein [Proteobacteria bacterium]|nr:AMP-binding protein [Pseudomonadota bacterium]